MESIEFINRFELYLNEISEVVKPELLPIIDELYEIDLQDLVRPDAYFEDETHARDHNKLETTTANKANPRF